MRNGADMAAQMERFGGLYLDEDDLAYMREQIDRAKRALDRHMLDIVREVLIALERMVG